MIDTMECSYVPLDEPIDLLNVAFENPRKLNSRSDGYQSKRRKNEGVDSTRVHPSNGGQSSIYSVPDRLSGLEELEELRRLCPGRRWNFVSL
jgi:hypothetical protein